MRNHWIDRAIALIVSASLAGAGPIPALWAAEAATLDGIEVDSDQVTVYLSARPSSRPSPSSSPRAWSWKCPTPNTPRRRSTWKGRGGSSSRSVPANTSASRRWLPASSSI